MMNKKSTFLTVLLLVCQLDRVFAFPSECLSTDKVFGEAKKTATQVTNMDQVLEVPPNLSLRFIELCWLKGDRRLTSVYGSFDGNDLKRIGREPTIQNPSPPRNLHTEPDDENQTSHTHTQQAQPLNETSAPQNMTPVNTIPVNQTKSEAPVSRPAYIPDPNIECQQFNLEWGTAVDQIFLDYMNNILYGITFVTSNGNVTNSLDASNYGSKMKQQRFSLGVLHQLVGFFGSYQGNNIEQFGLIITDNQCMINGGYIAQDKFREKASFDSFYQPNQNLTENRNAGDSEIEKEYIEEAEETVELTANQELIIQWSVVGSIVGTFLIVFCICTLIQRKTIDRERIKFHPKNEEEIGVQMKVDEVLFKMMRGGKGGSDKIAIGSNPLSSSTDQLNATSDNNNNASAIDVEQFPVNQIGEVPRQEISEKKQESQPNQTNEKKPIKSTNPDKNTKQERRYSCKANLELFQQKTWYQAPAPKEVASVKTMKVVQDSSEPKPVPTLLFKAPPIVKIEKQKGYVSPEEGENSPNMLKNAAKKAIIEASKLDYLEFERDSSMFKTHVGNGFGLPSESYTDVRTGTQQGSQNVKGTRPTSAVSISDVSTSEKQKEFDQKTIEIKTNIKDAISGMVGIDQRKVHSRQIVKMKILNTDEHHF